MPNKSAALASVPTLTWTQKHCNATKMRGRSNVLELGENARRETHTKMKVKDETDRIKIAEELQKHSCPINVK